MSGNVSPMYAIDRGSFQHFGLGQVDDQSAIIFFDMEERFLHRNYSFQFNPKKITLLNLLKTILSFI